MLQSSNPVSPRILLALDIRDAEAWQNDYPDYRGSVRVVTPRTAKHDLAGGRVTALYVTESAARHHDAERAVEFVMHMLLNTPFYPRPQKVL